MGFFIDSLRMRTAESQYVAAEKEFLRVVMPLLEPAIQSGQYATLHGVVVDNKNRTLRRGEHIHAIPKSRGRIDIRHTIYEEDLTPTCEHDETTHVVKINTMPNPRVTEIRSLEHSPILHVDLEGASTTPIRKSLRPAKTLFTKATLLRTITNVLVSVKE